jgi:hypothetical protein
VLRIFTKSPGESPHAVPTRRLAHPFVPAFGFALTLTLALATGCSGDHSGAEDGAWRAERLMLGDTLVVRTLSGSIWGRTATLVEELAIGTLEGQEELMFGFVQDIAVDREGGVYAFDGQVPALRYFDASGRYVRTLGRDGSGPGEYRDASLGLAVRRDGRLVMRDPRNARLNVYHPDGAPSEHWPVGSGLFTSNALTLDTADHMYLKVLLGEIERDKPWPIGLLHLNARGELVDSIPPPTLAGEPKESAWTFSPDKLWTFSPLGEMIVGVNTRYSFEVRRRDGSVLRIEKAHTPVAVHPEERAEHEAVNAWRRKYHGQNLSGEIPPVPSTKPAYRALFAGDDGRIWVRLYTRAEKIEGPHEEPAPDAPPPLTWREPVIFDLFDSDGTYLGEVRVPPRTSLSVFRGDTVWGIRRGEVDEQYIVRLRLER